MEKKHPTLLAWGPQEHHKRFLLASCVLILCLIIITREQLLNGFSLLPGDRYDGVISTMILEHWFHFFLGKTSWAEVHYFFPYTRTIANTDAYFLNGLIYFPFRLAGLDPFLSAELVSLVIKSSGFIGAYFLCRKVFLFPFNWSLFAAILFTLSNGMTVHSSRSQLATVAFFPIMALLMWSMATDFMSENLPRFRRMGMVAGIFFGAWCLSCFYMAWFFVFFFTTFLVLFFLMIDRAVVANIKNKLLAAYGSVIIVSLYFVIALIPFMYAFIPKSLETGVRTYDDAYSWTVSLEGILQVGEENYFFGKLYNAILKYISPTYLPVGEYYNTGFPFFLFLLFLLGCGIAFKPARNSKNQILFSSLIFTTIFTWILTLNIFGYSAWYFVFHFFPGAKALRVVSVYQIFLALPVTIIATNYLSTRRLGSVSILLICVLLISEEINKPHNALNRKVELERISLPDMPPEECTVFYASGWHDQSHLNLIDSIYAHNVTAMFIAQMLNIPTINGIASFNPPDWDFAYPHKSDYDDRVLRYAKKHNISGLCKLNLDNKNWIIIADNDVQNVPVDVPFFINSLWEGRISSFSGLSSFESWGTWSLGDTVAFYFNKPLPARFKVFFTARAFGPNIGKEFEAQVGDSKKTFILGATDQNIVLEFENLGKSSKLEIIVPFPVSPQALGISNDIRKLGIGLVEFKIEAGDLSIP